MREKEQKGEDNKWDGKKKKQTKTGCGNVIMCVPSVKVPSITGKGTQEVITAGLGTQLLFFWVILVALIHWRWETTGSLDEFNIGKPDTHWNTSHQRGGHGSLCVSQMHY